jgi:hypothetical protein
MQNNCDTPLISEFLAKLKTALLCGTIKPSDAALAATRVGRLFFTDTHLAAMTRELLGYSHEQASAEVEVIKLIAESTEIHTPLRSLAKHRLLHGYRMPLFVALKQARARTRPRVKREDWFCPLSACEIEALIEQVSAAQAPYVVLDWSDGENGVFISSGRNLRDLHEGMKDLIAWCIDLLIRQLSQDNVFGMQAMESLEPDGKPAGETEKARPETAP